MVKIQDASPFLFPSSFPSYASESTPQSPPSSSASSLDSPHNSFSSVCGPPRSLSSSIHPPADAQSCGTRFHYRSTTSSFSSSSPSALFASRNQTKFQAYSEVLRRLKESGIDEANLPGFDDQLWAHFRRLPTRYALDVKRAEAVLMHKRLMQMAHDPRNRPAIVVRLVQIHTVCDGDLTYSNPSDSLPYGVSQSSRKSIHPPPAFGSSPNLAHLLKLALEANISDDEEGDNFTQANSNFHGFMHEVTFAADDKPRLLSQLAFILAEVGLSILEAHAFSTVDGYSLNVFVVDGWPCEETEQLRKALEMHADWKAAEFRDKGPAIAELTHGPKIWHVYERRKKHGAKE